MVTVEAHLRVGKNLLTLKGILSPLGDWEDVTKTPHKWLMTFGPDPVVAAKCRSYGFHVFGWYVQRCMPRDTSRPKAKEIVVTNYELSVEQIKSADLKRVVIEEDIAFEEASLPLFESM